MSDAESDEYARLDRRTNDLAEDRKRRDSDPTLGLIHAVAQTANDGSHPYPTQADRYFRVQRQTITGPVSAGVPAPEVEGSAAVLTPAGAPFFAFNLGRAVPPLGTYVIVARVDHRWVFRFDGSA